MKTLKLKLTLCVIMAVAIVLSAALLMQTNVKTVAATDVSIETVAFNMEKGASIRKNKDGKGNGIRFSARMAKSDLDALQSQYKSIEIGVLVAPNDYVKVNALSEENVFGANPKYDWAVWENDSWVYRGTNGKDGSPLRIYNFNATFIDGEEIVTHGSVTNVKEINLQMEFTGVAYIKAEDNDNNVIYKFAVQNENVRTVKFVAMRLIERNLDKLKTETDPAVIEELSSEIELFKATYLRPVTKSIVNSVDKVNVAEVLGETPTKAVIGTTEYEITSGEIDVSKLNNGGKYTVTVFGENNVVEQPILKVSTIITNKDEYLQVMNYSGGNLAKVGEYIVLGNDIDFNGASVGIPRVGAERGRFAGVFDGQGHVLSNIKIPSTKTIFGVIDGGTVKNVAFNNITTTDAWSYLANMTGGTLDNVYFNGTVNNGSNSSKLIDLVGNTNTVRNCVFKVSFTGTDASVIQGNNNSVKQVSHNYAITNVSKIYAGQNTTNVGDENAVYASEGAFMSDAPTKLTQTNGFNELWEVQSQYIKFGETFVLMQDASQTFATAYVHANDKIDLSAIAGGSSIVYALVNGKVVIVENNKFTVTADYVKDVENVISLICHDKIVVKPFIRVDDATNIISTAQDFKDFLNSYSESGDNNLNVTINKKYILANDIDMQGASIGLSKANDGNGYFKGTLDGLGHSISNFNVAPDKSLFGKVAANGLIENIAVTDATLPDNNSYIAMVKGGVIKNSYIECKEVSGNEAGVIISVSGGAVVESVVNVISANQPAVAYEKSKTPTMRNLFSVGRTTSDNCTHYDDAAAFAATFATELNSSWSKYWQVKDGKAYFGAWEIK